MQTVSQEYVESMKQIGRNRGYIKATLGIINSEAQENIEVADSTEIAYFSDESILRGDEVKQPYATCEENFSKVDGTMFFLPPSTSSASLYNNGIVSENVLGAIRFNFATGETYDVAGFTIDFGDCYPVDFTISNGTDTLTFTDNDSRYFTTDSGLHEISELTITATKMLNGQDRLRIYSLAMGVSNTFTNTNTVSYTQTSYVSPISDSLPSTDMTIVVTNYDGYYNPDNASSVLAFFEVGQEVKVQFGYDVNDDGNVEWLPESVMHLKEWSATDTDATFKATDIFDYLSGTYYGGKYYENGITLYDLATDVFEDAGITKYKIDTYLKTIKVNNPLPVVPHTQALQIIANAGKSILREDRDGMIYIDSTFVPTYTATSNGETEYSNVENIITDSAKIAFAIQSSDFSMVDGSLLFMDEDDIDLTQTGYVSKEIADADGLFTTNPTITLNLEADYSPYNFYLAFRNVAPKQFIIHTFRDGSAVEDITVDEPALNYTLSRALSDFNKMVIEFTIGQPNARITLDKALFGAPTDYTITRSMMMDSPTAKRQDKIRDIVVSVYSYKTSSEAIKDLTSVEIEEASEAEYAIYLSNASYGLKATVSEGTADVTITDSSAYRAIVSLTNVKTDTVKLTISGYEYQVDEQYLDVVHNANGYSQTWSNPLISTASHAKILESWLAEYYLGDVEYEFSWRSDPRVDANDLFYMELKSGEIVNIRGYQNTLDFNGAWSGSMKARKVIL